MKKTNQLLSLALMAAVLLFVSSCSKDEDIPPVSMGIQKSTLLFTEVGGEAHGDHFHGLGDPVSNETHTVEFDSEGQVTSGGHFHLEADAVYRMELKTWDHTGKEMQNNFIANKDSAAHYKAFLTGGNFVLNQDTEEGNGAVFQTRETEYADGTEVGGALETTGVISYLRIGDANVRSGIELQYVLRKLKGGEKEKVTRGDWQDETNFEGENILRLNFEPHVDGAHDH